MLINDEWNLHCDLIPILGLFEEATRYPGGSNYSTHNIVKPLITKTLINSSLKKVQQISILKI